MADILYLDYYQNPEILTDKLKEQGMEVDFIDPNIPAGPKKQRGRDSLVRQFWDNYHPRLAEYKLFIVHMGTNFQRAVFDIHEDFPDLYIALVSSIGKHVEREDNLLVCDYDSNKLIEFARESLK